MTQLLEAAPSFSEFHAEFLVRVVRASGAAGGAVWTRGSDGTFELGYQVQFDCLCLRPNTADWDTHRQIVNLASQRDRALWVPPQEQAVKRDIPANKTPYALLLTAITVDRQAVGVLEIFLAPHLEPPLRRNLAQFLTEISGFAAAYFYKSNWRNLLNQQQLWEQLEPFARKIHASLEPHEVAFLVASEGRRLLECDQLTVALRVGKKARVEAVSGALSVDPRSPLVRSLTKLVDEVTVTGETLVYQGNRDESLPPALARALDDYLKQNNCRVVIVMPVADERDPNEPPRTTLVAESHEPTVTAAALQRRLEVLAPHAGPALYNAILYQRLPLKRLLRPLLRFQDALGGRGKLKLGVFVALALAVLAVFTFLPAELRLEAKGQLLPRQRQMVFAPRAGKIVEVMAQNGDAVEKGQELLFLEDLETQLKIDQIGLKIGLAEKRLALLQEQLQKNLTAEERNNLTRERIGQHYELQRALVERNLLLQESHNPRKAPVTAPFAGRVVTFDVHEEILGKTVKAGDPLLRLARTKGTWHVELLIPEGNIAAVHEGFVRKGGEESCLDVEFLLASHPQQTFAGRLYREDLGGETTVKDNQVVLPARVRIADAGLAGQLEQLPVGVEVRARVHCGPRALGYVWFHDLWDFIYQRLLF
jgi:multidrug efflux pump subunit AcrA (membrane-fusion protein)